MTVCYRAVYLQTGSKYTLFDFFHDMTLCYPMKQADCYKATDTTTRTWLLRGN